VLGGFGLRPSFRASRFAIRQPRRRERGCCHPPESRRGGGRGRCCSSRIRLLRAGGGKRRGGCRDAVFQAGADGGDAEGGAWENPKSEARNTKQVPISKQKTQNTKTGWVWVIGIWSFEIVSYFVLRISTVRPVSVRVAPPLEPMLPMISTGGLSPVHDCRLGSRESAHHAGESECQPKGVRMPTKGGQSASVHERR
jgi:hypothetical protein